VQLVGYSLAFGPSGITPVLGDLEFGAFDSSDRLRHGTTVSEHTYFVFQLAFNVGTSHDVLTYMMCVFIV
jgi:ammonia channel protein AmtB